MKPFNYFQPTDVRFGEGRVAEVGDVVAQYGKSCLLVSEPKADGRADLYQGVIAMVKNAGVEIAHFDGVQPNPTLDNVTLGAAMAKESHAKVVLGVGGGSAIDAAKAIAVQATHTGTAWDYLWNSKKQPTDKTLPIVAVPTTAGTGSHVTQAAAITNDNERRKSTICHRAIFPRAAIVDPELTVSLPRHITASTAWTVFTHAFESYMSANGNYFTDMLALKAIRLVATNLPKVYEIGSNVEARARLCVADTLAGMCVANAGTTLASAMGLPISGHFPHVSHGESLAVVYPAFIRFTVGSATETFAAVGRILDSTLAGMNDKAAAARSCDAIEAFIKRIGMRRSLDDLEVPESAVEALIDECMELPDIECNPRIPTRDEVAELYRQSRTR
jgi:alcohol dehydrogenase class IV